MNRMIRQAFLLLFAIVVSVSGRALQKNLCTEAGFFPLSDNEPTFYGCFRNKDGELSLRYLTCANDEVFSATEGTCMKRSEINELLHSRTDVPVTTGGPQTTHYPITGTTPEITGKPQVTDAPVTTEKPEITDAPVTSEKPETTDAPVTTEKPDTTDAPLTTEKPETTENPEITDAPLTTEKPGTTEKPEITNIPVSTDQTETTTEEEGFFCPMTGFFPLSGSCNQFIYCALIDDDIKPFVFQCPKGQNFNPSSSFCESAYKCENNEEGSGAGLTWTNF